MFHCSLYITRRNSQSRAAESLHFNQSENKLRVYKKRCSNIRVLHFYGEKTKTPKKNQQIIYVAFDQIIQGSKSPVNETWFSSPFICGLAGVRGNPQHFISTK
ncbi:hypothetical protein E2C01_020627 [Portunus trituberculatus]|uniref:Uncharacterized protein n=1 Tax=Portunus trituberculatus TaxID=210409 RepID=A0A5B7E292_PORTR|nr:hypothetical protein [Portunus trituberculatus]